MTIPGSHGLKVLRDAPMRLHTTWRIGGPADFLVRAATPDDLVAAVPGGGSEGLPVTVIGGGSNLLVDDEGFAGSSCWRARRASGRSICSRSKIWATPSGCGWRRRRRLSWAGRYAAERGWAGMDWGVGLPGTIGGATVNNAGAHGTEQKDHLESVIVLHERGEIEEHPAAWLEPAYRHTIIKATPRPRPWTVLAAVMLLPKGDPPSWCGWPTSMPRFARKRSRPAPARDRPSRIRPAISRAVCSRRAG